MTKIWGIGLLDCCRCTVTSIGTPNTEGKSKMLQLLIKLEWHKYTSQCVVHKILGKTRRYARSASISSCPNIFEVLETYSSMVVIQGEDKGKACMHACKKKNKCFEKWGITGFLEYGHKRKLAEKLQSFRLAGKMPARLPSLNN